eukprot:TRINITY_DN1226_c0_g1_i1.p1 TRINITY_DN1226_c0_g1~~TRINITY_DN1226_c0_g1_i1.p1  ORF type:complete len:502 (-),score=104.55 TRINITY_DN1226_c0_g1_i1:140-1588(-)
MCLESARLEDDGLRHRILLDRGERVDASQEELESIFDFFAGIQAKSAAAQPSEPPGANGRTAGALEALRLPGEVLDWFVPRIEKHEPGHPLHVTYNPASEETERQLCDHVARLHRLGVPTFLTEKTGHLFRLFAVCEANIARDFLPGGAQNELVLAAVREGLCDFVLKALAETVVIEFFGNGPAGRWEVALFDASGPAAEDRWRISVRIVFIDVCVNQITMQSVLPIFLRRLTNAWPSVQDRAWAKALEAVPIGISAPTGVDALWSEVVNRKAYHRSALHPLCWCDAVDEYKFPANRPLRPLAFKTVKAKLEGQETIIEDADVSTRITSEADWISLASVRSRDGVLTEKAEQGKDLGSGWKQYVDPHGEVYYHNTDTQETTRERPQVPEPAPRANAGGASPTARGAGFGPSQQQQQRPGSQPQAWAQPQPQRAQAQTQRAQAQTQRAQQPQTQQVYTYTCITKRAHTVRYHRAGQTSRGRLD